MRAADDVSMKFGSMPNEEGTRARAKADNFSISVKQSMNDVHGVSVTIVRQIVISSGHQPAPCCFAAVDFGWQERRKTNVMHASAFVNVTTDIEHRTGVVSLRPNAFSRTNYTGVFFSMLHSLELVNILCCRLFAVLINRMRLSVAVIR